MVDEISDKNEISTETTLSLNLSGAIIKPCDEENSENSDCDTDNSLTLSNSNGISNTNVNVTQSSDVIIGPVTQFHGPVTIYNNSNKSPLPERNNGQQYLTNGIKKQNITNNTIKDAQLVTTDSLPEKPQRNKKWSLKKILLISFSILFIFGLILFIIFYSLGMYLSNENNKNNDGSSHTQIPESSHKLIYRDRWGGRKPLYERPQKVPVNYVIISHTAGIFCESISVCSQQMVVMQNEHVSKLGSPDIGYNFLIGADGNIYVGRGWDNHNFHMNLDTIGISFMGNFIYDVLKPGMIEAANELLQMGLDEGKLETNYILVAHNQTDNTLSPGPNVYSQIKFWPHFSPDLLEDIKAPNKYDFSKKD